MDYGDGGFAASFLNSLNAPTHLFLIYYHYCGDGIYGCSVCRVRMFLTCRRNKNSVGGPVICYIKVPLWFPIIPAIAFFQKM